MTSDIDESSDTFTKSSLKQDFLIKDKSFIPSYRSQYLNKKKIKKSDHERFEKINELFEKEEDSNVVLTLSLTSYQLNQVPSKILIKSTNDDNDQKDNIDPNENSFDALTFCQNFAIAKEQIKRMKENPPPSQDKFKGFEDRIKLQQDLLISIMDYKYDIQNKIDVIRKHDIVSSIYTALNTATEKLNMFKLDKK